MPCYTPEPSKDFHKHLTWMLKEAIKFLTSEQISSLNRLFTQENLCAACKYLTKEQMSSISDNSGWQGLFHWYCDHILSDYIKNYRTPEANIAQEEAKRLGLICEKLAYGFTMSEAQR